MLRGIGSARTARGSAEYEIAESTAAGLVRAGYAMITRTGHRQLPAGIVRELCAVAGRCC